MSILDVPKNIGEQLNLLEPYNNNRHITHESLHSGLLEIISKTGVEVVSTFCRTKSLQRLREKIARSSWEDPIVDIHAARLVLGKKDFAVVREAIFDKWPSPDFYKFSWGELSSFRDYSDPEVKARLKTFSDPSYKATHLSIVVPFGARFAEVQLYTVADLFTYVSTQTDYQNRQRQYLRSYQS